MILIGVVGFVYVTWQWATIPDLKIRPDSLVTADEQVCGIEPEGTVVCWGEFSAAHGTLPYHTGTFGPIGPARVAGIDDASEVALGPYSGCALREGAEVACWGLINAIANYEPDRYLFEDSTVGGVTTRALTMRGLPDIIDITGGDAYLCVTERAGDIRCANPPNTGWKLVSALSGAREVLVNRAEVCGITDDGTARCVEYADGGWRGPADLAASSVEHLVGSSDWFGSTLTCALRSKAAPSCWDSDRIVVEVPQFDGASTVYSRLVERCALVEAEVVCLDNNIIRDLSEFPLETMTTRPGPDFADAVTVGSFESGACATFADGTVRCNGGFRHARLGDRDNTRYSNEPVTIASHGVSTGVRMLWRALFAAFAIGGALLLRRDRRHAQGSSSP